jgi:hypothetical protein
MPSINQIINQNQTVEEHEQKLKERIIYHKLYRKWRLNNPTILNKKDLKRMNINQRYKSFIKEKDLVFIRGLADYIEAVKKASYYSKAIEKIYQEEDVAYQKNSNTVLIRAFTNSIWGSWFNLELIYFMISKPDSFNNIFENQLDPRSIPFERESFFADINRVHHYLLEHSTESLDPSSGENKTVNYSFNSIGSPSGILKIKGFKAIHFHKQRAQVLQYFYLNKSLITYSDYQDFNTYVGVGNRQVNSNQFRLIVNSINLRVKKCTSELIKELIIKQEYSSKARTANRYKMITF